jgi:hypothetical protein
LQATMSARGLTLACIDVILPLQSRPIEVGQYEGKGEPKWRLASHDPRG